MKKNRLKRFILIINNLSCMVIFGVATMSLVSSGFFVCHQDDSIGDESMELLSETISKGETAFGLKSHIKPMEKGAVDREIEREILNKAQQSNLTLVSVAQ